MPSKPSCSTGRVIPRRRGWPGSTRTPSGRTLRRSWSRHDASERSRRSPRTLVLAVEGRVRSRAPQDPEREDRPAGDPRGRFGRGSRRPLERRKSRCAGEHPKRFGDLTGVPLPCCPSHEFLSGYRLRSVPAQAISGPMVHLRPSGEYASRGNPVVRIRETTYVVVRDRRGGSERSPRWMSE